MRFCIRAKVLQRLAAHMHLVASKGISHDCLFARRITVEVLRDDRIIMGATNGHLHARLTLRQAEERSLRTIRPGRIILDSSELKKISATMASRGHGDHLLSLALDGPTTVIQDCATQTVARLRHSNRQSSTWLRPANWHLVIDSKAFITGVRLVSKFVRPRHMGYKIKYEMICLHFTDHEIRFVCGNGMRFAICGLPWGTTDKRLCGTRCLLPADQAEIMAHLVGDADHIKLSFPDASCCYAAADTHLQMRLTGIPDEEYIRYDNHAYRQKEAAWVLDCTSSHLRDLLSAVAAARDCELEEQGCLPTVIIEGNASSLRMSDGYRRMTMPFSAKLYPLGDEMSLHTEILREHLDDIVRADHGRDVRLHFVDEHHIQAQVGTLNKQPEDADGLPAFLPTADGVTLRFFFASVLEDDDETTST